MKKTLIIASFLTVLAIPSVTMAAWYNPFSWFRKTSAVIIEPVKAPEIIKETPIAPEKLPDPKPVFSNTITVENPKLQAQINSLIQSNTDLQVQLSSLTTKYNTLVGQNNSLVDQIKTLKEENTSLKLQISTKTSTQVVSSSEMPSLKFMKVSEPRVYIPNQENSVKVYVYDNLGNSISVGNLNVTTKEGIKVYSLPSGRDGDSNDYYYRIYFTPRDGAMNFTVAFPSLELSQSFDVSQKLSVYPLR